jgi:hypothetical protein
MSIIMKKEGRLGDAPKVDQGRDKIALPCKKSKMSNDRCSAVFFKEIERVALLAVVLTVAALAPTGCSSTGGGPKVGLTADPADPAEPGFSSATICRMSADDLRAMGLHSPESSH